MISDLRALLARMSDKPAGTPGPRPVEGAPSRPDFDPTAPVVPAPPPPPPVDPVDPVTPGPEEPTDPDPVPPTEPEPEEPTEPGPVTPGPVTPGPVTPTDPDPVPPAGPPIATGPLDVAGGRVTVLGVPGTRPVAAVEITDQPQFGHASVNPDNTIALVLSGAEESGRIALGYTVTYADGARESFSAALDVAPPAQAAGWGPGDHYMLETGADGGVVVESGENHRDVYIGGSRDALSRADIARLEGLRTADIDRDWLIANPRYGGSEEMALDADAGMDLWYGITAARNGPTSHWLRLEAGHQYDGLNRIVDRGVMGESELHPIHVTSWGEGEAPVLTDPIRIYQEDSENVVFSNVTLAGGTMGLEGRNVLFDEVTFTGKNQIVLQGIDMVTIRNSKVEDIVRTGPVDPSEGWAPHPNRIGGMYVENNQGMLIESSFIHHNGWADGYDGTTRAGQPPSMFSHNVYLQNDTTDVTFRDNVVAQAGSFGAQLRGGAFVEDNAFIDNNAAFSVLGGNWREDGPIGNFSLISGNLVTSGAYKVAHMIGAVSLGQVNDGLETAIRGNIVTHLANPDDPAEFARKEYDNPATQNEQTPAFDDTIIWNWRGSWGNPARDAGAENVEGLDPDRLDATTIQRYAAQVLGRSDASIDDLMDHLSEVGTVGAGAPVTADAILRYFREGFGIETPEDDAGAHRFAPELHSDGVRWDNRLNWERDVLPGRGDDVDLGGNRVNFGTLTARVGALDLGPGGSLRATSGRLDIREGVEADGSAGGRIAVDGAGQVWTEGVRGGALAVDVAGGRFANTGEVAGRVDLAVSDNGQALLGTDGDRFALADGGRLHVAGSEARVGFDGEAGGTAVLRLGGGELSFQADREGLGRIAEFRSGAFGDAPDVRSGIALDDATLRLDLTGGAFEGRYGLLQADEIVGRFGRIEVAGLRRDQDLRFDVDYEADVMELVFGRAGRGSGRMSIRTLGEDDDARADAELWAALTDGQGSLDESGPEGADDEESTELALL